MAQARQRRAQTFALGPARPQHRHRCLTLPLSLTNGGAKLGAALQWGTFSCQEALALTLRAGAFYRPRETRRSSLASAVRRDEIAAAAERRLAPHHQKPSRSANTYSQRDCAENGNHPDECEKLERSRVARPLHSAPDRKSPAPLSLGRRDSSNRSGKSCSAAQTATRQSVLLRLERRSKDRNQQIDGAN